MPAVFSLLVVLALSFFITRVAANALSLTGLSHDLARFQAISAFTGVGFTTDEAERAIDHPARRKIVMTLMVLGNAGVVTAISSLVLSFTDLKEGEWWQRVFWIAGGVLLLWIIRSSKKLGQAIDFVIRQVLRSTTELRVIDYGRLLDLTGDYEVRTIAISDRDWLCNQLLQAAQLFQEGVLVLGIHRADGTYLGVPRGETRILAGDHLVLYGDAESLASIERRRKGTGGDEAHDEAVQAHHETRSKQAAKERGRPSSDGAGSEP